MPRIDIETLVRVFESRIEALEKNPPDKIKTDVVLKLLQKAIEDTLKEHFEHIVYKEMKECVENRYNEKYKEFMDEIINDLFDDISFRETIIETWKTKFLNSVIRKD